MITRKAIVAILVLFAVLAGAISDQHAAHAQGTDNDYVDVGVNLEVPISSINSGYKLQIVVVNNGARTAYDVEVVVSVESPTLSHFLDEPVEKPGTPEISYPPIGSASLESNERSLRWSIPALEGGRRLEYFVGVIHRSVTAPTFDNRRIPHEFLGRVTTSSFESDLHKEDNTSRTWSYRVNEGGAFWQAAGNYSVVVSADDPSPSPGDTVNFTVTTDRAQRDKDRLPAPPIDLEVAIELTGGLSVTGSPTYTSSNGNTVTPSSVSYSNGVFNVGTLLGPTELLSRDPVRNSVTLPVTVASSAVVNEQCLTATLTGNPPPGTGPIDDHITDNVAKLCLGDALAEPLVSGQVDVFTVYPCVGVTDPPCDSTDDVRVRAINPSNGQVLAPGTALLQIDPTKARIYDGHTNNSNVVQSVNDGNTVSWQTAVNRDRPYTDGLSSGLELHYSRAPFAGHESDWRRPTFGFSARDAQGNTPPPGKVFLRSTTSGNEFRRAESPNYEEVPTTLSTTAVTAIKIHYFLEFEKLGTYKIEWHVKVPLNSLNGSEDCLPNTDDPPVNQAFCASETYIFHVGPIAELAVEDGGASQYVAADRSALTVVAVNNGPEEPSGGALVTGLPTDAEVLHVSHGTYNSSTGEWNTGRLRDRDYYRSAGMSEPTLVLGASAGDTASVSIASAENYEVCVGPESNQKDLSHTTKAACEAVSNASWNSTPVYDYKPGNNSATITAARGTGGGAGEPTLATPTVYMPAVGLAWDEVEYLYDLPVKHYETQWSSDGERGWRGLNEDTSTTESVDTEIEAGETRFYRVRVENQAGVHGTWSEPMSAMIEEEVMATAGAPDKPVLTAAPKDPDRREEILVGWTKPVENGSPIVSYTLEVSDSGGDNSWSASGATLDGNATSWLHTGLTGGTRKFYRLLATNLCDSEDLTVECHSLWSDTVSATTDPPGQSGPPTNVQASPDGDSVIDVTWEAPEDDGGTPITRYEVQWSADGTGGWQNAGVTSDGDTLTFKNTGMTFGTTRYYRVASRNSRGLSEWSAPPYASATTLAGVPGQPNLSAVAADANTIDLTWTVPADSGSPIIRYELEWSPDGSTGSWTSLSSPAATETSYSDGNLDPGTERYYRIRAVNSASPGEGSWSVERGAKTPPAVPGAPVLRAELNGENAIDLTWEPPTDDGGADISGYEIHVSTDGSHGSFSRLASLAATDRTYTHSGLQPGDERYYQIRARNSAGLGEFSQTAIAATLTGVPTSPGLTAQSNGSTEIKLNWTEPDDRGSEIQGYQLDESDDGSDWNTLTFSGSASDSEYVHTGLSGGTTKHYRVRAYNGNGDGQWSATRSATTDAGGPDAPTLTLTVASDVQIDLSWTVPADNGSSIRGYLVERSVDGSEPWERLTNNNPATTYSDDSLYRGMTRHYRVAAFNGAGTGPYSDAKSATTTGDPATAPGEPVLLRLSEVSRNQVTIAWDPPDDDGGAPLSGYEYEVASPCEDDPTTLCGFTGEDTASTTNTSARISGITTDGEYDFRVRAVNLVGKGEWSHNIWGATLRPSTGALVQVSPTTITVNEGATVTYTIKLSTAPPHPVEAWVQPRGIDGGYNEIEEAAYAFNSRLLTPNDWTHPDPDEAEFWREFSYTWNQGVRVTFTAPEDSDTDDEVAVMDHFVIPLPYNHYRPCRQDDQMEREQCEQDWEDAWADSPYRQLTGASVMVIVNDND